jgi:hypothetical protein
MREYDFLPIPFTCGYTSPSNKKKLKMFGKISPDTLEFQDVCQRQMKRYTSQQHLRHNDIQCIVRCTRDTEHASSDQTIME